MLEKKYNHSEVEENLYQFWLDNKLFEAGDKTKEPFCIVIPPPNVTGKLHLGHAWDTTIQDMIIRYKKMSGFDTLWLPGMDHAGIATQAKVDRKLKDLGINPRQMDREEWLKQAWSWKDEYALNIHEQWSKMGLALDYTKERFTLDEGLSEAVNKVFVEMYNKGLIYRGERIINWDPEAMTALSNEEVIYKDIEGAFYHLKYMVEGTDDYLTVATTRPETLFGDTALAVNPKDKRYARYIGLNVILPIVGKLIPVIGDDYADMDFGTGIVKITPAHDPNDFEVGNRHNLERVKVINPDGTMNENAGSYNGMDRFKCREKLVTELQENGLLIKIDKMIHSVGHSERTDAMVEPYLSKQWFVKMRPLADRVIENQKTDNKVNFVPKRFEKILLHWMTISHDWCISRQLWWGHRIPAWYRGEEIYVGNTAPKGEGWIHDEDVLDTWFSSALWPFSTLGWPDETKDLARYFPNSVLVTGYDIIPFWVCRMVFQSLEFNNQIPFKDCLIHGLIRDKKGRKMSKSLGNGVDPMDIIAEYGCDALRFFLTTNSAPGQDLRFDEEKVKASWNFINKLWNASRFVLMNLEDYTPEDYNIEDLAKTDKWILDKLNNTIKLSKKHMDKYEFNVAGTTLYNFIWNDFCDWYIELSKTSLQSKTTRSVLLYTLDAIIKLLHPFMPHVTEAIYQMIPGHGLSIMQETYPSVDKRIKRSNEISDVDKMIEVITKIRNAKQENNVGKDYVLQNNLNDDSKYIIDENIEIFSKLLKGEIVSTLTPDYKHIDIALPYGNIILGYIGDDNNEEITLALEKEKEMLLANIERRGKLLSNPGYVSKAPKNLIEEEQRKLEEEKIRLCQINDLLNKK